MSFFPAKRHVVSIDDDIEDVIVKTHAEQEKSDFAPLPPKNLDVLIRDAEQRMYKTGAHLWALSYSENPMYMTVNELRTGNGGTNAYVHGVIVRKDWDLKRTICSVIEDQELALRNFKKDGAVLRYAMCTVNTDNRGTGGISAQCGGSGGKVDEKKAKEERRRREIGAVRRLAREFPQWYRYKQKGGEGTNCSEFANVSAKLIPIEPGVLLRRAAKKRKRDDASDSSSSSAPRKKKVGARRRAGTRGGG